MSFGELPVDTIIPILEFVTIPTLFQLRLTNRALNNIICTNLNVIAVPCARNTYINPSRLLFDPPENGHYNIQWLQDLKYKYAASVLADRFRCTGCKHFQGYDMGIPDCDSRGDAFRARLAHGWRILQNMSFIAQTLQLEAEIEAQQSRQQTPTAKSLSKSLASLSLVAPKRDPQSKLLRLLENKICQKQIEYFRSLPDNRVDCRVVSELLYFVFWYDDSSRPKAGDLQSRDILEVELDRETNWAMQWIRCSLFHEGPDMFLRQWTQSKQVDPSSSHTARDHILQAWAATDLSRAKRETKARARVFEAVLDCSSTDDESATAQFYAYCDARHLDHCFGTASLPEETLEDVPFLIDFRTKILAIDSHLTSGRNYPDVPYRDPMCADPLSVVETIVSPPRSWFSRADSK